MEFLSFQLQVPRNNVILSIKVTFLRKELLEESVTVTKRVI